ncbi:3-dehydroquinate synthase [Thiomicrospira cyclica]|uniref:3-dehydroquinate synthase n=1 Tax=Thiomicrospira cyclica (strain DSM 14477 / JCM 11371 / ALM1) TaxID=717773 RepID=F6D923_THICA|nr:3-dehydroquinate synthase [Thiomicrospira cyclica]AEG30854.1 3-dehydroquinate synthase [Thiomicrospira cyclica ALM1]
MITLTVDLAERSYPIFIGQDLLQQPGLVAPFVKGTQVMIVTNSTVAPLYLDRAKALFTDLQVDAVVLPDGEEYKNLEILNRIFDQLIGGHFDRKSTLVALGGGVIGDMTGFAAAAYQRGVPFIQIPTTLLSQVDSSVGGKTGVNHPQGKNMIGAFHQPQAVVIDTLTLNTLEDRQLSAGLAEVIKYGLIRDLAFFEWLEQNLEGLMARDHALLAQAIERSCQNKADIVAADETEQGQRALLNLGHTFGHAIEAGMGYGAWLHGEAISAGMMQAAYMSQLLGDLSAADVERIGAIFKRAKLPIYPPNELSNEQFMHYMAGDKKVQAGKVRLVLLKSIGQAYISGDYPAELLQKTLTEWRS